MPGSSRQRHRKEATFLESVRELLQALAVEIKEVKGCVQELQKAYDIGSAPCFPMEDWWNDLSAWQYQGFDSDSKDETDKVGNAGLHTTPRDPDFTREFFLAYRGMPATSDPQEGLGDVDLKLSLCKAQTLVDTRNSEDICSVCGVRSKDCICESLFCRLCLRTSEWCDCSHPLKRHRCCSFCDQPEDEHSLFSEVFMPQLSPNFHCPSCYGQEVRFKEPAVYYDLQSASECGVCKRVDAQETLVNCSGENCEKVMHESCALHVTAPRSCHHRAVFVQCRECLTAGKPAICGDCMLEAKETQEKSQILTDAQQRQASLSKFEAQLNFLMDLVDASDSKKNALPKALRDLAFTAASESYRWFQGGPPSALSIAELNEKAAYLEELTGKIAKKCPV